MISTISKGKGTILPGFFLMFLINEILGGNNLRSSLIEFNGVFVINIPNMFVAVPRGVK